MKKVIFNIPFTQKRLQLIELEMKKEMNSFLERNKDVNLTEKEFNFLLGKAKDQLIVHIKEMSKLNEPWNMSFSSIPYTIYSNKSDSWECGALIDDSPTPRFYLDKNNWHVTTDTKGTISFDGFIKKIYHDNIYPSSRTAAFYAIESYVDCRGKYPNVI